MLWQNWGLSSKETLQVDRTLGIAMSPRYFKFLNGVRSGMNCSDDDESSFARCVAGKQGDDLRVANLSCVPPQLATLAPDLEVGHNYYLVYIVHSTYIQHMCLTVNNIGWWLVSTQT